MIADRSGIHSVLLPLLISLLCLFNQIGGYKLPFIAMGCLMLCTLPLFLLTFHLIGTKNQGLKNVLNSLLSEISLCGCDYWSFGGCKLRFEAVAGSGMR